MGISVLGPVTIDGDGTLAPREKVVLAALVVRRGEVVSADTLADAMWGERLPPSWSKVVQGCVVRLRKELGSESIATRGNGYSLAVSPEDVDAYRFERLINRAQELLTLGEPDRAMFIVDEALSLWRGQPLVEVDGWEQGRIEAHRLNELKLDAEELQVEAALQAGRYRQVLPRAQASVGAAPLRERRWALLALAQYQAGRQGDSLRTLYRARRVLADELGLEPGPEIVALEEAILRQDPSLVTAQLPAASPVCPYLGMVPYDVADADAFFGRDAEIGECLRRLTERGVLVLVGPSGSGKSSLARAGVAARLVDEGRQVAVVTPGQHPMAALSDLGPAGSLRSLVVDQCEEVVTLCDDPDERAEFLQSLVEHTENGQLVVALRADRLGEISGHSGFAAVVEEGLYLVRAMDEGHLRSAIEGPARQAGLLLEPGLVDLLIRDVEGEPGSLPLLSHALRETWERREGNTLTVVGYQSSGGIRGAVAQSAEQIYEQSDSEQQPMLRDMMLRLVSPSPDGDSIRARVPRRVVAPDAEHEEIVEQLVNARLIISDQDVVELAHESLARAWPRLKGWLDDDVEGQRIWRHLAAASNTWDGMDRPASELYRGVRLGRAIEWQERSRPDLNSVEREFLIASREHAEDEQRAAVEESKRQVRANRRLRTLVAWTAFLTVIAVVAGLFAFRQARRADAEAAQARSHELAAFAISTLDEDPSLAKLLAVTSASIAGPSLQSASALHKAWSADLSVARFRSTVDQGFIWGELSPAGDRMVVAGTYPIGGSGWELEMVETGSGRRVWYHDLVEETGKASAFLAGPLYSVDGSEVILGVFWDPQNVRRLPVLLDGADEPPPDLLGAHILDAESGLLKTRIDLGRCGGLVLDASSTHLVTLTLGGPPNAVTACDWDGETVVELVDIATGERRAFGTGSWQLWGGAISEDGRYLAYDDGPAGEVVVLDLRNDEEVLRAPGWGVRQISPSGDLLLMGDEPIDVLDVGSGELVASFTGHQGTSEFAVFGPDGETVYSTGQDGSLRVWEARTGDEIWSYPGVGNGRLSLSDTGLIAVAKPDRESITVLDTKPPGQLARIPTCDGVTETDAMAVIGQTVVFPTKCDGVDQGATFVVDVESGKVLRSIPGHPDRAMGISPDGRSMVRQEGQGTTRGPLVVRDLATGDVVLELDGLCTWDFADPRPSAQQGGDCRPYPTQPFAIRPWQIRWSPDGSMIAATLDSEVVVWDSSNGELLYAEPTGDRSSITDILFSPDSLRLVVTHNERSIRALSTETWETVVERSLIIDGAYSLALIGFDDSGERLVAAGPFYFNVGGSLTWFDAETLEPVMGRSAIHEATIVAVAMDPDRSRVATAGSDGLVRIWDVGSGDLMHEVPVQEPVQGVGFLDDDRIAVTTADGDLIVTTLDDERLLATVASSLTRGFTSSECARFGFDDLCPTLAELGGAESEATEVDGLYEVTWSPDEVDETADRAIEDYVGPLVPDDDEGPSDLTLDMAGDYSISLRDGRFDIHRNGAAEPWCAGTYSIDEGRLWLHSERGSACYEVRMFDSGFVVDDQSLRLDPDDFRGTGPDWLIFTQKPLERVD